MKNLKDIPVVFNGQFPKNYINSVKYWGNINKEDLHSIMPDGTAKMLMMDLDFGNKCSLACPHCFRRDSRFDSVDNKQLSYKEIISYIKEARKIGLRQIKIIGRGEPFENEDFLGFLREVNSIGVGVSILTKGHVIGSDELAKRYNTKYGINSSKEFVDELKKMEVSICLGFNSFNKETQEKFVGSKKSLIKNYVDLRNRALVFLVEAGFNDYVQGEATRLSLVAAPIKPENVKEIFGLYKWARMRNIYMLSCPTTISGKGLDQSEKDKEDLGYYGNLKKVYINIYTWAIKKNLISLDSFCQDGVSLYPGCHPCNQTAAGFYLNLSGQVVQCPGRVDKDTIFISDIRDKGLLETWKSCANYKRAKSGKKFNYHCVARDVYSLPKDFYVEIEREILKEIAK